MRNTLLPFAPPSVGQDEIDEVVETLRSNWLTTGPKTRRFERELAGHLGAPAALAVSSGTAALQVALAAHGVGPDDEIITTTMTFCSTVHAIEQSGATPLPVHLYGHPAEMDALESIAAARQLFVLEDAAHALPASYRGRTIGSGGRSA